MDRRTMIAGLAALPLLGRAVPAQTPPPYRVSLIGGAFDGAAWAAGVAVDLDEGWKTYWRMPGEAGIPPQFDWSKSKGLTGVQVFYPLPGRFHDLSGETVGYHDRVVFPVIARPVAGAAAAELHLDLFFAVCKDVCIPAKAEGTLDLAGVIAHTADTSLVDDWMKQVPVAGTAVSSVRAEMDGGKPVLVMKLTRRAADIFVESESSAYFRAPEFSPDGLTARLAVDNLKDAAGLKGMSLKLTLAVDGSGIEQTITVD